MQKADGGNHPLLYSKVYFFLATLFDPGGFTAQLAKVEDFRTTDHTTFHHLDLFDVGRGEWEDTLDTNVIGNFPDCEGGVGALTIELDYHTLVLLNTFFFAFLDPHIHSYSVTCTEVRVVIPPKFGFYEVNEVFHCFMS